MKKHTGYAISFIEEILFIGFVTAIVSFIKFEISIGTVITSLNSGPSIKNVFYFYIVISLIGYPCMLAISLICQKYLGFYDNEFKYRSISDIIIFDIYNDVIFPIYLLTRDYPIKPKLMYLTFFWIIPIAYSAVNLIFLF